MGNKTKIDWCDSTWNPVTGCLHGCEYCYARSIAKRFGGYTYAMEDMHDDVYANGDNPIRELNRPLYVLRGETFEESKYQKASYPYDFIPTLYRYRLDDYVNKKGRNIFVCSMADLFGDWVPDSWLDEVFAACEKAPQHNYLFLTKNPKRYVELINNTDFFVKSTNNMWFGYSYTDKHSKTWWNPDYNIFVSVEPILEPIEVPKCKWLIVGAETGKRKDRVIPERKWIEHIVESCRDNKIPVFMKNSLAPIWGDPLIKEFPEGLKRNRKGRS